MSIERVIREEGVLSPSIRPAAVQDMAELNSITDYLAKGISEFMLEEREKIAGSKFLREYMLNRSLEKHLKKALKHAQLTQNLHDATLKAGMDIWATYLAPAQEDKEAFSTISRQDTVSSATEAVKTYFEHSAHEIDDKQTSYGNLADALVHRHERAHNQTGVLRRAIGGATAGIALMALVAGSNIGCTGDQQTYTTPADAHVEMIDDGDAGIVYNDKDLVDAAENRVELDAPLPAATVETNDYRSAFMPQAETGNAGEATLQSVIPKIFAAPAAQAAPAETPATQQTAPTPTPAPEPKLHCDQAAYNWMMDAAKNDSPLSRIGKYNLSPDGKEVVSHQGIVNIAFHYGTRTDSDPANDYTRSNRQPGQWGMANQWLLDHTGRPIWKFTANRAEPFTIEDIDEEYITAETLPECSGTPRVYAPVSSSATHTNGQHAHAAPQTTAEHAPTSHADTQTHGGAQPAPQEAEAAAQPGMIVAPSGATVQYGWNPIQHGATQQPAAPGTSEAGTVEPIVLVVPAESGEPIVIQAPAATSTPVQPESAYPALEAGIASYANQITGLAERVHQTSQLIDTLVDECSPGSTGNSLCSMQDYSGMCNNGNPRVPMAPGETTACRAAEIQANSDIEVAEADIALFELALAELKKKAEEAGAIEVAEAASQLTVAVQDIGQAVSGMTLPGTAKTKGLTSALDTYNSAGVTYADLLREYTSTRADRLTVKELKEVFGLDELLAAHPEYSGARARADAEERTARRELAYEARAGGMSAKRIAECLDVSKSTVYRDLKAYTQPQNDAAKAA